VASSSSGYQVPLLARFVGLGAIVVVAVAACGPDRASDAGADTGGSDQKAGSTSSSIVVQRVIDGDSLELVVDGGEIDVRLLGINAPELRTLSDQRSCPGDAARGHLESLLEGAGSLVFRAGEEDRFGRRLGVIDADGHPVTESMVTDGWALALWSADDERLTASMLAAAEADRGWWGAECGPPASATLAIGDHQANAPGDDRENLAEEWVEVVNTGPEPVDLDGWTIRDETTSNQFRISGLTLHPGRSVRFRSGSGPTTADDYYLGEQFPVWSNGGDTALLVDPAGIVAAYAFLTG